MNRKDIQIKHQGMIIAHITQSLKESFSVTETDGCDPR